MADRSQRAAEPTKENVLADLKQVMVISVMHTGTHFVAYEVFKGWQQWQTNMEESRIGRGYILHHFGEVPLSYVKRKRETHTIITPMRHPHAITASWVAKQRKLVDLVSMMAECYSLWKTRIPMMMPIDTDQREMRLQRIAAVLPAVNTETNWPVVRYKGKAGNRDQLTPKQVDFSDDMHAKYYDMFVSMGYRL